MDEQEGGERDHLGIVREHIGQHRNQGEHDRSHRKPTPPAPLDHPITESASLVRITGAEGMADHRLRRDRHCVEREGENAPDLECNLVSSQVVGADACGDGDGHGDPTSERSCAHEEVDAGTGEFADDLPVRCESDIVLGDRTGDPPAVRTSSDPLGDHGRQRRRTNAVRESIDQHQFDDEVEHGGADSHVQRPFRVLQPPQVADTGQDHQHRGNAEQ